jgi:membrane protein DedA with SNARE-associated domain
MRPVIGERGSVRRRQRADVVCAALLMVNAVYNLVVVAMIPSLVGRSPVLLEALGGSVASMVAAGSFARVGRASLALALAAPVLGLANTDPLTWWGGRRWGRSMLERLLPRDARAERRDARAERWFVRWGGWTIVTAHFLPVPSLLLYAMAGWTRMPFWRFAVLDLLGTFAYAGMVVGLGYAIGHPAVSVVTTISHYALGATLALVVGLAAISIWRQRRHGLRNPRPTLPSRARTEQ